MTCGTESATHIRVFRRSHVLHRRQLLTLGSSLLLAPSAHAAASPYTEHGLIDQGGADLSLADVAEGRTLILVVMKGHYCPVCRAQLMRLQQLMPRLRELQTEIAGIDADPFEANRAISEKYGLTMSILSDREHAVIGALGLWLADAEHPMPAIVVFDRCGREVYRLLGRDPDARPEAALLELARRLHHEPPQCTVA